MQQPIVRVVVVNYNGGVYLRQCLEALRRQSFEAFEAIIVDNASTDGSLDAALPAGDPRFSALRLESNIGFAAANNRGAEGVSASWIVTLNPDAFPEEDWLKELLFDAEAHPEADMIGSTQLLNSSRGSRPVLDGAGDNLSALGFAWRGGFGTAANPPFPSGECFSPCAAGAMYRTTVFRAVGGFDERFFCYMEDVDLGFRIRLRGGRCYQSGRAVLWHVSSGVTGRHSYFSLYQGYRNMMWLTFKCIPSPLLPFAIFAQVLACLLVSAKGLRNGTARAGLSALRDGLKGAREMLGDRRRLFAQRNLPPDGIYRALTWNPLVLVRRSVAVKPWQNRR